MAKATWVADATYVTPAHTVMIAGEDIPLALDAGALLGDGETLGGTATATLIRLDTLETVEMEDEPTVAGDTVTLRVRDLVADTTYLLHVFVSIGARVQAMSLVIECNR